MEPIRVECYAGYKANQEPRVVHLGDRRLVVLEIVDRWYDPAADYFRVRLDDGQSCLIRYDREADCWELVAA